MLNDIIFTYKRMKTMSSNTTILIVIIVMIMIIAFYFKTIQKKDKPYYEVNEIETYLNKINDNKYEILLNFGNALFKVLHIQ